MEEVEGLGGWDGRLEGGGDGWLMLYDTPGSALESAFAALAFLMHGIHGQGFWVAVLQNVHVIP